MQAAVLEDDGEPGTPTRGKKGARAGRREGRKGRQGAEEPGAAIPGAILRMSEWPLNDDEV